MGRQYGRILLSQNHIILHRGYILLPWGHIMLHWGVYRQYAAYAAYGWGPRAERTWSGGGNTSLLGPTIQYARIQKIRR